MKLKEVVNKLDLKRKNLMRESDFTTKDRIFLLHPTKGTQWVCYRNIFFASHACQTPILFSKFTIKRNGDVIFKFKIQGEDSYSARYCLYNFYPTRKIQNKF